MDETYTQRLADIVEWLSKEFLGIRTGQATPALLDGVKVESYGSMLSLQQVGSVGVEDARTIRITPWDNSQIAAIERAIRDADLGLSVVSDSAGLRAIFPDLTSERRTELVKHAKSKLEDARVSVRGVRDDEMKKIDALHKQGELSDDERTGERESLQKEVESTNRKLEQLFTKKETEITTL